ncbi:hypothetical protein SAY86_017764 [Trapa natans]|uniref:histone acetyltransferase n=1 Tax=Trapa natans TaxID=22666 RepID=A0AAN7R6Y0_TRANT|nr:hypothetical protein SAY86_017764 [Trapa natans]
MGGGYGFQFNMLDFSGIFGDHGRIYGYKGLKISIWMNIMSFQSFCEIYFEKRSNFGKGITDLESGLKTLFVGTLVDNKDDFIESFSRDSHYIRDTISSGKILWQNSTDGHEIQVIRMGMGDAGYLYVRLVPLIVLLVEGFSYKMGSISIDLNDEGLELYLLIEKPVDQTANNQDRLLGFSSVYRYYHYPDGLSRLRLNLILVLPPYRCKGYGRRILRVLKNVAITEDAYDLTVKEPSEELQHMRTCIDVFQLLSFDPVQDAVDATISLLKQGKLSKNVRLPRFLPPLDLVEDVRKTFRINKSQFLQCWEVLVYVCLSNYVHDERMDNYFTIVSNRVRAKVLGTAARTTGKKVMNIPNSHNPRMSFVMFRVGGGINAFKDQNIREEHIKQLIDRRLEEIKLIAEKVLVPNPNQKIWHVEQDDEAGNIANP